MTLIFEALQSVIVLLIIMTVGFLIMRLNIVTDYFSMDVSKIITLIGLPAIIFYSVLTNISSDGLLTMFQKLLVPVIATMLNYFVSWLLSRLPVFAEGDRGVFINASVNANTTFIGLAINNILFGKIALASFLVYFLTNNLSIWAFGQYFLEPQPKQLEDHSSEKKANFISVLESPPLLAFLVSFVFVALGTSMPLFILDSTQLLGELVTPLALLYSGMMLYSAGLFKSLKFNNAKILGIIGRFVLGPLLMYLTIVVTNIFFPGLVSKIDSQVWLVQSGTPVMAILPVLATQKHSNYALGNDLVVLTTVLFVFVLPVIFLVSKAIF